MVPLSFLVLAVIQESFFRPSWLVHYEVGQRGAWESLASIAGTVLRRAAQQRWGTAVPEVRVPRSSRCSTHSKSHRPTTSDSYCLGCCFSFSPVASCQICFKLFEPGALANCTYCLALLIMGVHQWVIDGLNKLIKGSTLEFYFFPCMNPIC